MTVSIKEHFKHHPTQETIELKRALNAVEQDLAALRLAFTTLTAKVDTDFTAQNAAVTSSQLDTNYAAGNPAALNLVP